MSGGVALPSLEHAKTNVNDDATRLKNDILPMDLLPDLWRRNRKADDAARREDREAERRAGQLSSHSRPRYIF
jgi:hypothetical protein